MNNMQKYAVHCIWFCILHYKYKEYLYKNVLKNTQKT